MSRLNLTVILSVLLLNTFSQKGEKRIALVIGNSNFIGDNTLKNPANDASRMASTFTQLGFTGIKQTDVNRQQMAAAIANFDKYPNNTNTLMLNACGNNPFKDKGGSDSGFRSVNPSKGTKAFAAAEGESAGDDSSSYNGLYTATIVTKMKQPVVIEQAFRKNRSPFQSASNNERNSLEWNMLNNDFYFVETIGSNIKDNDIKAKPNNINTVSSTSNDLSIGKPYAGGIIFYIDETGEHGLIAAPSDQGTTGIQWYNGSNVETGATGTSIGTGQANTSAIVAVQGAGSYAAKVCDDLVLGGYSDWFLPSRDELNLMYTNLEVNGLGGFGSFSYWSSSEYDSTYAWKQSFGFGYQNCQNYGNKFYTYYVRAVRAF